MTNWQSVDGIDPLIIDVNHETQQDFGAWFDVAYDTETGNIKLQIHSDFETGRIILNAEGIQEFLQRITLASQRATP